MYLVAKKIYSKFPFIKYVMKITTITFTGIHGLANFQETWILKGMQRIHQSGKEYDLKAAESFQEIGKARARLSMYYHNNLWPDLILTDSWKRTYSVTQMRIQFLLSTKQSVSYQIIWKFSDFQFCLGVTHIFSCIEGQGH